MFLDLVAEMDGLLVEVAVLLIGPPVLLHLMEQVEVLVVLMLVVETLADQTQ